MSLGRLSSFAGVTALCFALLCILIQCLNCRLFLWKSHSIYLSPLLRCYWKLVFATAGLLNSLLFFANVVPPTALRLEGLAQDKERPPPLHKRSQTHRGWPIVVTTTPSPTSPTLPTPPMSPNQLPPYRKPSWPLSPPSGETPGHQHLNPHYSK